MTFNEISIFKLLVSLTDYNENISWVIKILHTTIENVVFITDVSLL